MDINQRIDENMISVEDADTTVRELNPGRKSDSIRYAMPEGTILDGRYRILRVIGQGGFGITYEAVHIHNDSHVAIKEYFCRDYCGRDTTCVGTDEHNVCVLDDTQKKQFRSDLDRFMKEARTLHDFASEKAIVTVMDYFEANETAYIVMEYLDGKTLRDLIPEEGRWGMEKVVRCFGPVMEAMERVHAAGVIHRDISPDNLMYMPDGTLRLLDFGAARKFSNMQTTHSVIYKAYYSAPEQRDEKGVLGSWTDVYGLSSTMYFCLTEKEPEDVLTRLLYDDMDRPSSKGADILPQAERTLMKGLELDREKRIQDMRTLRTELEKVYPRITEDEKKRGRARRKRRKRIAAITAAAIVLCAAFTAFMCRTWIRFQFIDTQETVLDGEDMTPEEFADSSAKVKDRIEALCGKKGYLWDEDGQQIRFTVPSEVYEGQDPETYVWASISRRMIARLRVRDVENVNENGETELQYRSLGVIHQEEDIADLQETEEGVRLFFSEEGIKRFGSVLDVPDLEIVIIWDEYDEETGKGEDHYTYNRAVTDGDGESILIVDAMDGDIKFSFPLLREVYTSDPSAAAFQAQSAWVTRWEDPASTLLPGKYQCKDREVPSPSISVHYSSITTDELEGESGYEASILSFQAILKNRLDSIGVPYAVGVNVNNRYEYVVRLPLESIFQEELQYMGVSKWIHIGSDRAKTSSYLSGTTLEVQEAEEGDSFELVLTAGDSYYSDEINKALLALKDQGKKEIILYLDDLDVAAADLQTALKTFEESGEIRFSRWTFADHPEMTSDTEHFARFMTVCIGQDPQDSFFMQGTEICGEKGKVLYFDERQPEKAWTGRVEELVEKWKGETAGQQNSDMYLYGSERKLYLNYYGCPVEDPAKALLSFMDLYEKEDLGACGIDSISVDLYDGKRGEDQSLNISLDLHADFDTDSLLIGDYNTIYSYTEDTSRSEKLPDLYADYMEKTPFWKEKIAPDRDKPLFDVYP